MKKIQSLEDFDENLGENQVYKQSKRVQARFTLSGNMKRVSKIQKTLIDLKQLLVEMSDEIVALRMEIPNMDNDTARSINALKHNIDNMVDGLSREKKNGRMNGLIGNSKRMLANLENIKEEFLTKRKLD